MSAADTPEGVHYLLGHTPHELRRLEIQGDLYRDETRRAFVDAGITEGMRVLDIGCGTGDVSRVAASIVGDSGAVLGIDRGPDAVATARALSESQGVPNTRFEVCEIEDVLGLHGESPDDAPAQGDTSAPFDALVGRFILMHQQDPVVVLRTAAKLVRPGGVVCIVESHMDTLMNGVHSIPHSPFYDEIVRWKGQVVGGAGADCRAGGRLRGIFEGAGLIDPKTTMHARLEGGPTSPYYEYIAHSVRSMLPEATRQGLGGFTEADVESIEQRLREETVSSGGVLVAWPTVAASARVTRQPTP